MNEQEFVSTFLTTEVIYESYEDIPEQNQRTGWFDMENGYYIRVFKVSEKNETGTESQCRYVTGVHSKSQNGVLSLSESSGQQVGSFQKGRVDLIEKGTLDYEGLKKFLEQVASASPTAFADVEPKTKDIGFAKKVIPFSKIMPTRGKSEKNVCCPNCQHEYKI